MMTYGYIMIGLWIIFLITHLIILLITIIKTICNIIREKITNYKNKNLKKKKKFTKIGKKNKIK